MITVFAREVASLVLLFCAATPPGSHAHADLA